MDGWKIGWMMKKWINGRNDGKKNGKMEIWLDSILSEIASSPKGSSNLSAGRRNDGYEEGINWKIGNMKIMDSWRNGKMNLRRKSIKNEIASLRSQ